MLTTRGGLVLLVLLAVAIVALQILDEGVDVLVIVLNVLLGLGLGGALAADLRFLLVKLSRLDVGIEVAGRDGGRVRFRHGWLNLLGSFGKTLFGAGIKFV